MYKRKSKPSAPLSSQNRSTLANNVIASTSSLLTVTSQSSHTVPSRIENIDPEVSPAKRMVNFISICLCAPSGVYRRFFCYCFYPNVKTLMTSFSNLKDDFDYHRSSLFSSSWSVTGDISVSLCDLYRNHHNK